MSKAEEEVEPVLMDVNELKQNVSEVSQVSSEMLVMRGIPKGCRT